MKILEELYDGEIQPVTRGHTDKELAILQEIIKIEEELFPILTKEAKEMYERVKEKRYELMSASHQDIFEYGFSLGIMMISEAKDKLDKLKEEV